MPQQALAVLEQVTRTSPNSASAWQLGFDLLIELKNEHEAVDWGLQAVRLLGDEASSKFAAKVSSAARQSGRVEDSERVLSEAMKRAPENATLSSELGWTLLKKGEFANALQSFRLAVDQRPLWPQPGCGAALALRELGQGGEATRELEALLVKYPDDLSVLLAVAQDRKFRGLADQSLALLTKARGLFPKSVEPLVNMGPVLSRKGDIDGVLECLESAIRLDPQCAPAHLNLSLQLLALGRFAEGWQHYQYRHRILVKRNYVAPLCPGDPTIQLPQDLLPIEFGGKKVTLVEDQGLGDELSFLRFVPLLRARGAYTVYMPDPRLRGMVERAGIVDRVASPDEDAPPDTDILLACGELPLVLGHSDAAELPPPVSLTPLEDARIEVRNLVASLRLGNKPLIGLTWRAGHLDRPKEALFKEAPLEAAALLLRDIDAEVLCLQRRPASEEIELLERILGRPVADFSDLNQDLELMLALLDELDDYIAVSNTNVHLRAGLGKTARILVPHPPDYRWMAAGDESPWFRGFTIYRQAVSGAWRPAFEALQADLWSQFAGQAVPATLAASAWPEETLDAGRNIQVGPQFGKAAARPRETIDTLLDHAASLVSEDLTSEQDARLRAMATSFTAAMTKDQAPLHVFVYHVDMGAASKIDYRDITMDTSRFDYGEIMRLFVEAVARWHPEAVVFLATRLDSPLSRLAGERVRIVGLDVDASRPMYERVWAMAAYAESSAFTADTLFLDSDAFLNARFDEFLDGNFDVAVTVRDTPGLMPVNEGVMAARHGRADAARRFFRRYLSTYEALAQDRRVRQFYGNIKKWRGGQLSLNAITRHAHPYSPYRCLEASGIMLRALPCDPFNYSFDVAKGSSAGVLQSKVVVHLKGGRKASLDEWRRLVPGGAQQRQDAALAAPNPAVSDRQYSLDTTPPQDYEPTERLDYKTATLTRIADHFKTDKGSLKHRYTETYSRYLEPLRGKAVRVMEIGVACGSSLKMWAAYFGGDSRVVGIDIRPECAALCSRYNNIEIVIGDAATMDIEGTFDVIIDDGSHVSADIVRNWRRLWRSIKPGGYYIIEDLKCTHDDSYRRHFTFPKDPAAFDRTHFVGWIDDALRGMDTGQSDIEFIHFYRELVVLRRKVS